MLAPAQRSFAIAPSNGLKEAHRTASAPIDIDIEPELSWDSYARKKALLKSQFNPSSLVRYA